MAQPAQAEKKAQVSDQQQRATDQIRMIQDLQKAIGPFHPMNPAASVSKNADNAILMGEIVAIMRGKQPAVGDPSRTVWDEAIKAWGSQGSALDTLMTAHVELLNRLSPMPTGTTVERKMPDVHALPDDVKAALLKQVTDISTNIYSKGYENYQSHSNSITLLKGMLSLTQAEAAGQPGVVPVTDEKSRPGGAVALPTLEVSLPTPDSVAILSTKSTTPAVAYGTKVTDFINSTYGGTLGNTSPDAIRFVSDLALAYTLQYEGKLTGSDAVNAAHQLYGDLMKINGASNPGSPGAKSITHDANFGPALTALKNGDLATGLKLLQGLSDFNGGISGALLSRDIITVNQQSVVMLHAGVFYQFNLGQKNMEAFMEWLQRNPAEMAKTEKSFEFRLLWAGLGAYFNLMQVTGTFTSTNMAGQTLKAEQLSTIGEALGFTPAFALGGLISGRPVEVIVHGSFELRNWELSKDIPTAGGTQKLSAGEKFNALNPVFYGIEIRLPDTDSDKSKRYTSQNFGIAGIGSADTIGGTAYYTGLFTWHRGDKLTVRSWVRPEVSYFLDSVRLGMRTTPVEFGHYWGQRSVNWGPYFNFQYSIGDQITRLEGGGKVSYSNNDGVTFSAFGGAVGEVGGSPLGRIPTAPTFGLTLSLDDRLFQKSQPKRTPTPSAAGSQRVALPPAVARIYTDAVAFYNNSKPDELNTAAARETATRLAGSLDGATLMSDNPALMRLRNSATFKTAVSLLREGDLKAGLTELQKLAAFKG